jgi:antirestriction protein ArdC
MVEAGKILGIPVQDHIILGGEGVWYSMFENGDIDVSDSVSMVAEAKEGLAEYSSEKRDRKDRQTYREKVKERFVQSLQENPLTWKKEWSSNETGRPYNLSSGYAYKGLNALYLKCMEIEREYRDPRWLTFKQAAEAGYGIPKGTKMTPVEYFFMYDTQAKKTISWKEYNKLTETKKNEVIMDSGGARHSRYVLRSREHHVFNASQLEGVPELDRDFEYHQIEPSEVVKAVAAGMGVEITEKEQGRAFYSRLTDSITLPLKEQFESDYAYQTTALHELGHATGHECRLGREVSGSFGSPGYAHEELIAEIASCFMGEYLPVEAGESDISNHVAYVQNWLEAIDQDPNYLYKAIKAADQAADYMIEKGGLERVLEKTLEHTNMGVTSERREMSKSAVTVAESQSAYDGIEL